MTPDARSEDLRRLWKGQPDDVTGLSLDVVRTRSHLLERRVRRRNYVEYAAALVVLAFVGPRMWTAPNGVLRAGAIALLAGITYVTYRTYTAASPRTMPADAGVLSSVEFHRAELERQRDALHDNWRYLLPFWPGMALILVGLVMEQPDRWLFAVGTAALTMLIAFQIAWTNKRSAKALQETIDRFKENPVAALRTDPPSLTLGQRLSVWIMTSSLGATAVFVVMQRFFPEAKASILGLVGLPPVTPNAVVILVLLVAGVAVQAAWWTLRRR